MTQSAASQKRDHMIIEPCPGRARALYQGTVIAQSDAALVLRETGYPPRVYFPRADVRMDLLRPSDHTTRCPHKGTAAYWHLAADGRTLDNAAWAYLDPLPGAAEIAGRLSFTDAVQVEA